MIRLATLVLALLVLLTVVLPGTAVAGHPAPKVVVVVGPVGAVTDEFQAPRDEAAAGAAEFTPNLVKGDSPEAREATGRSAPQSAPADCHLDNGNCWLI